MGANKYEEQKRKMPKIGKSRTSGGQVADWTNADEKIIKALIVGMAYGGGAVRFGYTRDGGAYAIGIYNGDERNTFYATPKEDINEVLTDLLKDVAEAFTDR